MTPADIHTAQRCVAAVISLVLFLYLAYYPLFEDRLRDSTNFFARRCRAVMEEIGGVEPGCALAVLGPFAAGGSVALMIFAVWGRLK